MPRAGGQIRMCPGDCGDSRWKWCSRSDGSVFYRGSSWLPGFLPAFEPLLPIDAVSY